MCWWDVTSPPSRSQLNQLPGLSRYLPSSAGTSFGVLPILNASHSVLSASRIAIICIVKAETKSNEINCMLTRLNQTSFNTTASIHWWIVDGGEIFFSWCLFPIIDMWWKRSSVEVQPSVILPHKTHQWQADQAERLHIIGVRIIFLRQYIILKWFEYWMKSCIAGVKLSSKSESRRKGKSKGKNWNTTKSYN